MLLVQLSDTHIGADWVGPDSVPRLDAAIATVRSRLPGVDAVIVTGDLGEHGAEAEYATVRERLERLGVPFHVLPGNHDDRAALRRAFALPGAADAPVQYALDLGAARVIALDTTRPGEPAGALDDERLAWLDAELGAHPGVPTLLAMHHPPVEIGIPAFDDIGLVAADRRALGELLGRHPQVRRLVAGHVHRVVVGELAGRAVITAPAIYAEATAAPGATEFGFRAELPGFAVHRIADGAITTHIVRAGPGGA